MKRLTDSQKTMIQAYRSAGLGYKAIAGRLSLSRETVQSYCRRMNLNVAPALPENGIAAASDASSRPCKRCGKPVQQKPGTKKRLFCSDACRQAWWNDHPEEVKRKAVYAFTCAHCGQSFTAYGNNHRKYCSHACYIAARFGNAPAHCDMDALSAANAPAAVVSPVLNAATAFDHRAAIVPDDNRINLHTERTDVHRTRRTHRAVSPFTGMVHSVGGAA